MYASIHAIEKRALPEFFNGKNKSKSPEMWVLQIFRLYFSSLFSGLRWLHKKRCYFLCTAASWHTVTSWSTHTGSTPRNTSVQRPADATSLETSVLSWGNTWSGVCYHAFPAASAKWSVVCGWSEIQMCYQIKSVMLKMCYVVYLMRLKSSFYFQLQHGTCWAVGVFTLCHLWGQLQHSKMYSKKMHILCV